MKNRATLLTACGAAALTAMVAVPGFAGAELTNGIKVNERVFNDFPGSTLNVTNNYPTTVVIDESGYTGSGFANRHDALASTDGGATVATFNINEAFPISADVTLAVGSNAPRKEAGIRVNSGISGDALFLVNSDAGEIVSFGGGAAFNSFGNNGGGDGYTPGDTIFMQMNYTPSGSFGVAGKVEYIIDRGAGAGLESSGLLDWSNLEGGPVSYSVGFYGQFSPDVASGDSATATFSNIVIVPEPASLALLSLGGLAMPRRRAC